MSSSAFRAEEFDFTHLPAELLTSILASTSLTYADLLSVSRVSRILHAVAQPMAESVYWPKTTHFCSYAESKGQIEEYNVANFSHQRNSRGPPPSRALYSYHGQPSAVRSLISSSDGHMLATLSQYNNIILWDVETKEMVMSLDTPTEIAVHSLALSSDASRLYCGGFNRSTKQAEITVLETPYGELVDRLDFNGVPENSVGSIAISNGSKLVAAGLSQGEGGVVVWIKGDAKSETLFFETKGPVRSLVLSQDETTIIASTQKDTIAWSLETKAVLFRTGAGARRLLRPAKPPDPPADSPLFYALYDISIKVYDSKGACRVLFDSHKSPISVRFVCLENFQLSPQGRVLFVTTDLCKQLLVLDTQTGHFLFAGWLPRDSSPRHAVIRTAV